MFWGAVWLVLLIICIVSRISYNIENKTHGKETFIDREHYNDK
jgi:hypothetical protein